MKAHHVHLLIGTVLTLTVVATVGMTMDWSSGVSIGVLLGFMGWAALPTTMASIGGWIFRKSRAALVSCMIALFVSFGLLAYCYVYSFIINPDPQGGLIMIFGPLYAAVALLPFGIAALVFFLLGLKGRKSSPAPRS